MSAVAEFTWNSDDPKAEFLSLFQNAPLGLLRCEMHGCVTALNPAMERILGARSDVNSPLLLSELIQTRNCSESKQFVAELLDQRLDSFQVEGAEHSNLNRPLRWSAWRVGEKNDASRYILASAEISNTIEQRLRQAERLEAVGRLTGGVAHDFNNLLTGVLLYCDLLMAAIEPDNRAHRYAEEIRKAGFEASALVRQLLSVVRPANGEARLLSFNEIAQSLRNFLDRLIGENITLTLHLDSRTGVVRMDPSRAQQILLNLVLNARDAMPAGGEITIETSDCRVQVLNNPAREPSRTQFLRCVLVVVADNGIGMDSATRAHLFEPFFTTKAEQGTGLGLATVHNIVSTHGGLIHVESESGAGTSISVLLPVARESPPVSSGNDSSQPGKNETSLLFEEKER